MAFAFFLLGPERPSDMVDARAHSSRARHIRMARRRGIEAYQTRQPVGVTHACTASY